MLHLHRLWASKICSYINLVKLWLCSLNSFCLFSLFPFWRTVLVLYNISWYSSLNLLSNIHTLVHAIHTICLSLGFCSDSFLFFNKPTKNPNRSSILPAMACNSYENYSSRQGSYMVNIAPYFTIKWLEFLCAIPIMHRPKIFRELNPRGIFFLWRSVVNALSLKVEHWPPHKDCPAVWTWLNLNHPFHLGFYLYFIYEFFFVIVLSTWKLQLIEILFLFVDVVCWPNQVNMCSCVFFFFSFLSICIFFLARYMWPVDQWRSSQGWW